MDPRTEGALIKSLKIIIKLGIIYGLDYFLFLILSLLRKHKRRDMNFHLKERDIYQTVGNPGFYFKHCESISSQLGKNQFSKCDFKSISRHAKSGIYTLKIWYWACENN